MADVLSVRVDAPAVRDSCTGGIRTHGGRSHPIYSRAALSACVPCIDLISVSP